MAPGRFATPPGALPRGGLRYHTRQVAKLAMNYRGERTKVVRGYVFDLLGRFTPIVASSHRGITYLVSTQDGGLGRQVFCEGSYEEDLLAYALCVIETELGRPSPLMGRTFIDVGANIGTSLIPALLRFDAQDAVAFEPAPQNLVLLRSNILTNGLDERVRIVPKALSDEGGVVEIELAQQTWGDHRVRVPTGHHETELYEESTRPTIDVPVACFDDAAAEHGIDINRIGLFWVDVQGHEGHVLAGARSILASDVPVVVEYWPYALNRAGGLGLLHTLISTHFRRIVDIRASFSAGTVVARPSEEVSRLQERYQGPAYTDLLLVGRQPQ